MKKAILFKTLTATLVLVLIFNGCIKDKIRHTYTLYYPVYKTTEEVRANIKSDKPAAVINPGKLFVSGNYIFLNEVDKGIHIIDNSNPSSPVNKYFINIPGNVDVAVKRNTLYADLYSDLVTIDITDPANVRVNKIIENAFPNRRYANGFLMDSSKIIVDWIRKDTMVYEDAQFTAWQGPRTFIALSSLDKAASYSAPAAGISGSMARFTLMSNYLYTVTDNALNVFDISQPLQPVFSNKVALNWGIETIYPFKNNLFIGSTNGMYVYGTSNPAQPNQLSMFTHATRCDPVIADDKYAFVTLRSGNTCGGFSNQLDVLNVQDVTKPSFIKTYPLTNPHDLSKDGNLLFICDGTAGLKVFNATDVSNLQLVQTINMAETYDVIATGNLALVVAKDGLYQYSYSNPLNLKFLSKITYNN